MHSYIWNKIHESGTNPATHQAEFAMTLRQIMHKFDCSEIRAGAKAHKYLVTMSSFRHLVLDALDPELDDWIIQLCQANIPIVQIRISMTVPGKWIKIA